MTPKANDANRKEITMKKNFLTITLSLLLCLCMIAGAAAAFADGEAVRVYTLNGTTGFGMAGMIADAKPRSEERRVGKECRL